jgi:hypothetical protein
MIKELHDNGYIIMNNTISQYDLSYGLSCIEGNKVNYRTLKYFIDHIFIKTIAKKLSWNPIYLKFRFSNKQNAKDASTFHSDIYNFADDKLMPIYTALCYFDNAQMQIIPSSHLSNKRTNFLDRKTINLVPGDILVFHANLHHRGLFYDVGTNRRLLQVFEVFPDTKYLPLLKTVLSANTAGSVFNDFNVFVSKYKFLISSVAFVHYYLMFYNIHYKIAFMDISDDEKKDSYITYEAGIRKKYDGLVDDFNINIIVNDSKTIQSKFDLQQFLFILIIFVLIVFRKK